MAGKDEGPLAKPGEDPYHIEWPDDGKEMRAAERAKLAKRAAVNPAPRYLAALVLGLSVVLGFLLVVAVSVGQIGLFPFMSLPVILVAVVLVFPIWIMLDRISRGWRTGLPEMAFLVVGLIVGFSWTYAVVTLIGNTWDVFETADEAAFFRSAAGIFMATATASGFMAAKFWAVGLRQQPRVVYGLAIGIGLVAVMGVLTWTVFPLPGA